MTRRIVTVLLALLMLIALVPAGAVQASAASSFTCSDEFIDIVKEWEGFSAKPYWDVSHYSIGYGTTVPDDKLAEYKANGITEEEAEQALREHLTTAEAKVNAFIDKHSLNATQGMFDAMVSISFNCGSSWLTKESTLRTAIIEGWTGNDLLFAMGQWSTAAGTTRTSLINRRMSEANMYLNGGYAKKAPANYSYVRFDANGGESVIITQCFDTNTTAEIRAVPTYDGYVFKGWYTDATGGDKVTKLDSSVKGYMLYAHWAAASGTKVPANEITGNKVNYSCTVTTGELSAFNTPANGAVVVDTHQEKEKLNIVSEHSDANGVTWGETSEGGWVNLSYTSAANTAGDTMSVKVTVTGNSVNIRKGAGTNYASVKQVNKGYTLTITQTKTAGGYTWGKSSEGWIALKYTNYASVSGGSSSGGNSGSTGNTGSTTENKVVATGKVAVNTKLNVRKGAGTGYSVVATLKNGTAVKIYETKKVGSVTWGRIDKGWISLEYVKLDKQESTDTGNGNTSGGNTSGGTTSGGTTSGGTTSGGNTSGGTTSGGTTSGGTTTTKITGTVKVDSWLNVRSGAGTGYSAVARLTNGTKVEITEQKTVKGTVWGKMSKGWVSMDYIVLDKTEEAKPLTGTISCGTAQLRVRQEPGSETVVKYLVTGDKVTILEQKTVNGVVWGRLDNGWVMMQFVVLDGTTSGSTSTKVEGTITGNSLRIRSGAGTSYSILGYLNKGDKVTILETKTVNGVKWARIEKGWISMEYVKI